MRIVVIRAFLLGGERQEVGLRLDLPEALARELAAMGKAEFAADPVADQPADDAAPESTPAPAPAPAKPKSRTKA